jgi:hypothetical protein
MSPFAEQAVHKDGRTTENLRVLRAVQTSSIFKPVIDQAPIPPDTNDHGAFSSFFSSLLELGKNTNHFELFTMDGGFCSLYNAALIDTAGYAFLMTLKENQHDLYKETQRIVTSLVDTTPPEAATQWERHGGEMVKRELWRTPALNGYPTTAGEWNCLRRLWLVRTTRQPINGSPIVSSRFFVTNLLKNRLTARQCLDVVLSKWGVEDDCFWSLDREWQEDLRAWCLKNEAVLCQSDLRIMAYHICRIVRRRRGRCRKDGRFEWPAWSMIFHWIERALTIPLPLWVCRLEGLPVT